MNARKKTAIVLTLLVALSACGGGSAPSDTIDPEATETVEAEPSSTPDAEVSDPPDATPATVDNGSGRPASITLDISGTPSSDGAYTSSGPARLCGNAVMNITGNVRSFSFEFPGSGEHQIRDVTVSADDLLPGATTAQFHIGVTVKVAGGGLPPATVVDTESSGADDSGSARLTDAGGTTTLVVQGSDEIGQTISMTATCGPR